MAFYRALDPESSEIRLVRFINEPETRNHGAPIKLQLRHESLNGSDTKYAALSYAWGKIDPVGVYVDGHSFEIGRNLHDALMQLRRSGITSWLWIDAICIQQTDVEEKT